MAFAQDVLVAVAYAAYPACVLHGGTAIWRCYGGTRFSDDLDAYLPRASAAADPRAERGQHCREGFNMTGHSLRSLRGALGGQRGP